jgi:hypothetical protein
MSMLNTTIKPIMDFTAFINIYLHKNKTNSKKYNLLFYELEDLQCHRSIITKLERERTILQSLKKDLETARIRLNKIKS